MDWPFIQPCTSYSELRAKQLVAERGKTSLHRRPFPSWSSTRNHANTSTIFVLWNKRSRIKRTYFLLINLTIAALLVGITELTVLGAFKSEVMPESDIGHSLPEDASLVSGVVTTTLMRV